MRRRPLGSTGLEVAPLGLGTVKFGRNQGVKYPRPFEIPGEATLGSLLDHARDLGVNLLDTAPAYGTSEEVLGRLLASRRRDDWVIVTKVGEEFVDGASAFDFSAAHTRRSIERSLRRLGVDHLDLVLVHSDGDDLRILEEEGCYDVLEELRDAGVIRAFGMSTKTVEGGIRALDRGDVAMVWYNPVHVEELPVLEHAAAAGKGILVKKGLASGHLDRLPGDDPAGDSIRFALAGPAVAALIVGTITPAHLEANCRAAAEA